MFFFQIMKGVLTPNIQILALNSYANFMKLAYKDQKVKQGQLHDGDQRVKEAGIIDHM